MEDFARFCRQLLRACYYRRLKYPLGSEDRAHAVDEARRFIRAYRHETAKVKPHDIFDDFDALTALAEFTFARAAQKAVTENDRLGIPTAGSVDGRIVYRVPPTSGELDIK